MDDASVIWRWMVDYACFHTNRELVNGVLEDMKTVGIQVNMLPQELQRKISWMAIYSIIETEEIHRITDALLLCREIIAYPDQVDCMFMTELWRQIVLTPFHTWEANWSNASEVHEHLKTSNLILQELGKSEHLFWDFYQTFEQEMYSIFVESERDIEAIQKYCRTYAYNRFLRNARSYLLSFKKDFDFPFLSNLSILCQKKSMSVIPSAEEVDCILQTENSSNIHPITADQPKICPSDNSHQFLEHTSVPMQSFEADGHLVFPQIDIVPFSQDFHLPFSSEVAVDGKLLEHGQNLSGNISLCESDSVYSSSIEKILASNSRLQVADHLNGMNIANAAKLPQNQTNNHWLLEDYRIEGTELLQTLT